MSEFRNNQCTNERTLTSLFMGIVPFSQENVSEMVQAFIFLCAPFYCPDFEPGLLERESTDSDSIQGKYQMDFLWSLDTIRWIAE